MVNQPSVTKTRASSAAMRWIDEYHSYYVSIGEPESRGTAARSHTATEEIHWADRGCCVLVCRENNSFNLPKTQAKRPLPSTTIMRILSTYAHKKPCTHTAWALTKDPEGLISRQSRSRASAGRDSVVLLCRRQHMARCLPRNGLPASVRHSLELWERKTVDAPAEGC